MAELLRETLEAYALRAPSADGLQAAVDARAGRLRGRRRWVTAVGVVAATLLVLAGAAVLSGDRTPRNVPLVAPADPPGTRLVLWHGVEVAIPERFFHGTFNACGAPETDVVVLNDIPSSGDCAIGYQKGLTLVYLMTAHGGLGMREGWFFSRLIPDKIPDVLIDGTPARRITGKTEFKQYAEWVVVPSRGVQVLVTTDDPAEAGPILDSVRVTPGATDRRGCAIREDAVYLDAPPARPGARTRMVPDAPVQASVCRYGSTSWVNVSKLVGAEEAADLAEVLNALPAGFNPPSSDYAPRGWITVRFRYERGPEVVVRVHWIGLRDVGATNGAVRGRLTPVLQSMLRPIVGWHHTYEQERVS